jgi:hypothetical protein
MKAFEHPGRCLKPVLSVLSGKLPALKHLTEFWKSEVEYLSGKNLIEAGSFDG